MGKIEKVEVAAPTLFDANHEDYVQALNTANVLQKTETQKFSPENVEVLEKLEAVKTTATMPRMTRDEQPNGEAFKQGFLSKQEAPTMLPIHTLSLEVQRYIEKVSEVFHVHRDIATSAVYSAISATVGKRLQVECGPFVNTPCLWLMQVAEQGGGKTPTQREVMRPVLLKDRAVKRESEKELRAWQDSGSKGKKPGKKQIFVQDATPEYLPETMSNNPHGVCLFRPELCGWLDDMGRYSKSGEVNMWLQVWSGEDIGVDRITRDASDAVNPYCSVFGGVQPRRLSRLGSENLLFGGFVARLLFVFPPTEISTKFSFGGVPAVYRDEWQKIVNRLLDVEPKTFKLSPDAEKIYGDFYAETQGRINPTPHGDEEEFMNGMLRKKEIYVLRWALLTHILGEDAHESKYSFERLGRQINIDAETMQSAVTSMSVFEEYAMKAFQFIVGTRDTGISLKSVAMFLRKRGLSQPKIADVLGVSQSHICNIVNGKK